MLFLSGLVILISISCSEDDRSDSLIGTWVAESIVVTGCSDESRNGTELVECNDSCYRLVLESSGDYSFQREFSTEVGTWDAGDRLRLCQDEEGEIVCEEFNIDFAQINLILSTDSTSSGCVTSFIFAPEVAADTTQTQ